jgi:ubiquinone/menaquinone biosynthesis C-methylase UbiE
MAHAEGSPEALAKAGYNAQAQRYLEWTLSQPSLRESFVEKVINFLEDPLSASVLELGCGAGVPATKILAEKCGSVIALDISSTQIALAQQYLAKQDNVLFMEKSMTDVDFPDGKFNTIVALYSIIHLDPESQKAIFQKIRRWLKPGGILLVNLVVMPLPGLTLHGWLDMKAAYWSSFGQEENIKLLQSIGLKILESDVSQEENDVEFGWFIAKSVA